MYIESYLREKLRLVPFYVHGLRSRIQIVELKVEFRIAVLLAVFYPMRICSYEQVMLYVCLLLIISVGEGNICRVYFIYFTDRFYWQMPAIFCATFN